MTGTAGQNLNTVFDICSKSHKVTGQGIKANKIWSISTLLCLFLRKILSDETNNILSSSTDNYIDIVY